MKILITGGLGFVGTQLSFHFLEEGHQVTVVDHSPRPKPHSPPKIRYVSANTSAAGPWQEEIPSQDLLINLAGASIFGRWSKETKRLIHESRVLTTRNLVEAMPSHSEATLLSTSAVGYYGFRGDEQLTEAGTAGNDFLARLCVDWEEAANAAGQKGARVVTMRFGIVLGKTGGALQQMISAFDKFVGGPLGSGDQWFSWIHMADLVKAIVFLAEHAEISGPVNCCSPHAVRNKELARVLGRALHRPSFLSTPAFMLRLTLGEFASVLLEGQHVIPAVLLKQGFQFKYPGLDEALASILSNR